MSASADVRREAERLAAVHIEGLLEADPGESATDLVDYPALQSDVLWDLERSEAGRGIDGYVLDVIADEACAGYFLAHPDLGI